MLAYRSRCVRMFISCALIVCGSSLTGAELAQPHGARPVPEFASDAMAAFFGDARAAYLYSDGSVLAQMWEVLGIPDGDDQRATRAWDLGGGRVLHAGCRQHSCMEKGAVVYDAETRTVLAAGMLRFRCAETTPSRVGCSRQPILTTFVSAGRPAPSGALATIEQWADAKSPDAEREMRTLP